MKRAEEEEEEDLEEAEETVPGPAPVLDLGLDHVPGIEDLGPDLIPEDDLNPEKVVPNHDLPEIVEGSHLDPGLDQGVMIAVMIAKRMETDHLLEIEMGHALVLALVLDLDPGANKFCFA